MNRDIEFRIWADNQFYYKCLVGNTNNIEDNNWTCPMVWLEDKKEWVNCDNGVIQQYTGLKDKNGKKIFEGDIIDIHQTVNGYNQFVIEYDKYKFSARYYNQDKKQTGSWYGYDLDELFEINESEKEIEVIGNIYENKELLGDSNER